MKVLRTRTNTALCALAAASAALVAAPSSTTAQHVIIAPGEIHTCKGAKDFALTFDDGPHPQATVKLLDILKANTVHATFFVIGSSAVQYPDIIRRAIAEGHQVASHTYNHPDLGQLAKLNLDAARKELADTNSLLVKIAGFKPLWFRPPYGSYSAESDTIVKEFNLTAAYWSVDTKDFEMRTVAPNKIFDDFETQYRAGPGASNLGPINLQHDIFVESVDQVQKLIDWGKRNGFTFKTVAECTGRQAHEVVDRERWPGAKLPDTGTGNKPGIRTPGEGELKVNDAAAINNVVSGMLASFAALALGVLNYF